MNTNSVPRSQVDVIKNASSQILDSLKRLELTVYTPKYPVLSSKLSSQLNSSTLTLRNLIRAHAKLRLGIDNHVPPGEWPTADPDITQQLTTDEGFRGKPQMKDLRLDWDIPGITLWSQWIAALFEADFVYEYSMGSFPDLSSLPQAGYVAQIFLAHVKGWKSVRLEAKKDTGNRQYRHSARKQKFRARQRRAKLWNRRMRSIQQHGLSSLAIDTLRALGYDGMSSDESEGEVGGNERQFHIKMLPWRNAKLTAWLHGLDSLGSLTTNSAKTRAGRRPRFARVISRLRSIGRTPPSGLAQSLYDPEWISQQGVSRIQHLRIESPGSIASLEPLWMEMFRLRSQ